MFSDHQFDLAEHPFDLALREFDLAVHPLDLALRQRDRTDDPRERTDGASPARDRTVTDDQREEPAAPESKVAAQRPGGTFSSARYPPTTSLNVSDYLPTAVHAAAGTAGGAVDPAPPAVKRARFFVLPLTSVVDDR